MPIDDYPITHFLTRFTLFLDLQFSSYRPHFLGSNALWSTVNYPRPLNQVYLTEFFGAVNPVGLSGGNWLNLSVVEVPEPTKSRTLDTETPSIPQTEAKALKTPFDASVIPYVGAALVVLLVSASFIF